MREGLTLVRAVRSRYDGLTRNPFNEYECGSYYARAMASFALLQACSGCRYSAVTRTLWLSPKLPARPWRSPLFAATGYATVRLDDDAVHVEPIDGTLAVDRLVLGDGPGRRTIDVGRTARAEVPLRIAI